MKTAQQVFAVLAEAKREGLAFEAAWYRVMEALRPERGTPLHISRGLEEERDLTRECKPSWRAAYEGRDLTAAEYELMEAAAAERLDPVRG